MTDFNNPDDQQELFSKEELQNDYKFSSDAPKDDGDEAEELPAEEELTSADKVPEEIGDSESEPENDAADEPEKPEKPENSEDEEDEEDPDFSDETEESPVKSESDTVILRDNAPTEAEKETDEDANATTGEKPVIEDVDAEPDEDISTPPGDESTDIVADSEEISEEEEIKAGIVAELAEEEKEQAEKAESQTPVAEAGESSVKKHVADEKAEETAETAEEANSEEEKTDSVDTPAATPRKAHYVSRLSSGNSSQGQILQEARVQAGLSIEQVAQSTKIKHNFVEALERDDEENLPPQVYIKAYVKRLCAHYGIDEKDTFKQVKKIEPTPPEQMIPEEILQHIEEGKQVNVEEEAKVKKVVVTMLVAGLILISTVGLFIFFQWSQKNRLPTDRDTLDPATKASYQELARELENFIPPQLFTMNELPFPGERD